MELPQRRLPEIVEVQFQRGQIIVGLERLSHHFEAIVVYTVMGHIDVDEGPVLGQCLRDSLGPIVSQPIRRKVERLEHTELGDQQIMECLSPLERNFISSQVQYSKPIVFKGQLFDGVDGIAVEQIFAETEFLQSAVDLQHLGIVDGALLADALVVGGVQVECAQGTVVPVEHTGHADDAVDVEPVVAQVQLLQGPALLLVAGEEEVFGDTLGRGGGTIAPGVPILLYCRFTYLMLSLAARAVLSLSALGAVRLLPCRFKLTMLGHLSRYLANISTPISEISL